MCLDELDIQLTQMTLLELIRAGELGGNEEAGQDMMEASLLSSHRYVDYGDALEWGKVSNP